MKKQFIKVVRMGQKNVRILLNDGSTLLIPRDEFTNSWEQGPTLSSVSEESGVYSGFEPRNSYISDLTFGLELEFIGRDHLSQTNFESEMIKLVGDFKCDPDLYSNSSTVLWALGRDGSLRTRREGYRGYELTSPILHFNSYDLIQLQQVLACVKKELKGHVNGTCGLHVHVGTFEHLSAEQRSHIMAMYGKCEQVLDRFVSKSRRGSGNRYCLSNNIRTDEINSRPKYRKLSAYRYPKFHTLECRHHQGSLDFPEIVSWVELIGVVLKQIMNNELTPQNTVQEFLDCLWISDECKEYFTYHAA